MEHHKRVKKIKIKIWIKILLLKPKVGRDIYVTNNYASTIQHTSQLWIASLKFFWQVESTTEKPIIGI